MTAVVDIDAAAARNIAEKHGARALTDYRSLLGEGGAGSVVVPTTLHHQVSKDFLSDGAHVLVEKPIAATAAEARELIAIAAKRRRVLQVGHLERFNPVIVAAAGELSGPRFIESNRLAPFKARGTDVSVVLDMMIHDIDLIEDIVRSPIATIEAVGAPVFTDEIDIKEAIH